MNFPFFPSRAGLSAFGVWVALLCALRASFALPAGDAASWPLAADVKVDSKGVYLRQLVAPSFSQPLPDIRLADAPAFGRFAFFTRAQVADLLAKAAPDLEPNFSGPERIRVSRRSRHLDETEMRQLLTAVIQSEQVRERGELELRFVRPWAPVIVPDEPLSLRVLDLPNTGVAHNFIARCELRAGDEIAGAWQINVNAKIWREIWVARSGVLRGQPLASADVGQERRDVLAFRDGLANLPPDLANYDLGENLPGGAPLTARSIKQRPIIRRGKTLDALVRDGVLQILVKVEALEDGLPGQFVRVRNIKSRREFRGKVQDEQTVAVTL